MNNTATNETSDLIRTVSVTLCGETRELTIERLSHSHCWHATSANAAVVARFRTGAKYHLATRPQVFERDGRYFFSTVHCHNRNIPVVNWADRTHGDGQGNALRSWKAH